MSRLALLLVFALLGLGALAARSSRAEELAWLDDLDAARARALAEGRPVLAVFRCVP